MIRLLFRGRLVLPGIRITLSSFLRWEVTDR
jgi:hypothetical protein